MIFYIFLLPFLPFSLSKKMETKSSSSSSRLVHVDRFHQQKECDLSLREGLSLKPHQIEAMEWIESNEQKRNENGIRGGILAYTMGLGKTLISLSIIMRQPSRPTLVICPKPVLYEWKSNIETFFGHTCKYLIFHREYCSSFHQITWSDFSLYHIILTTYETVLYAAKKDRLYQRLIANEEKGSKQIVMNCSHPLLSRIYKNKPRSGVRSLFCMEWFRVILDESHRIANPSSLHFLSVMCLCSERKLCLSGTPLRNYAGDIYSQLRFIGFNKHKSLKSFSFSLDSYNEQKLFSFILSKDYIHTDIVLPEKHETVVYLELKDQHKEVYDYYRGEVYRALKTGVHFRCVFELFMRLRQLCCAPYMVSKHSTRGDSLRVFQNVPSELSEWIKQKEGTAGIQSIRVQSVVNILKSIPKTEKVLVFSTFKSFISLVHDVYTAKTNQPSLILNGTIVGPAREAVLHQFKTDPSISVMFIGYGVGSVGLNLSVANHVILCEPCWTPVTDMQSSARVYRIGQTKPVHVYKILVRFSDPSIQSIETRMDQLCEEKKQLIHSFITQHQPVPKTKLNRQLLYRILHS